jgi:hypothetical protein
MRHPLRWRRFVSISNGSATQRSIYCFWEIRSGYRTAGGPVGTATPCCRRDGWVRRFICRRRHWVSGAAELVRFTMTRPPGGFACGQTHPCCIFSLRDRSGDGEPQEEKTASTAVRPKGFSFRAVHRHEGPPGGCPFHAPPGASGTPAAFFLQ